MSAFNMRLNKKEDKDILEWLERQDDKTLAVKNAIRLSMGQTQESDTLDLLAIRQVFESVLDEKMSGLALETTSQKGDSELENKLDDMF